MSNIEYIHRFLTSLGFTAIVETLVLLLLLRLIFRNRELSSTRIIFAGLFASFATIPYVWLVFPYITDWARDTSLLWSEPFVFLVEAIFYRVFLRVDIKVALTLSLIANLASYFLGPILRDYGLWIYW